MHRHAWIFIQNKNSNHMKSFLLILAVACITVAAQAQTPPPTDAYVYFTASGGQSDGYFKVVLPDTTTIASIKVRLGTMEDTYDLTDYEFAFDVTSGLPSGFTYSRTNEECTLGVGVFNAPLTCFGEVSIKYTGGIWSDPVRFISN
jgi:hypothetical protein